MKELENLIEDMRHSERELKEYIFIDRINDDIYSFNSEESQSNFIIAYVSKNYYKQDTVLRFYNNTKIIVLRNA